MSEKPLGARLAEWIRGSPKADAPIPDDALPRPATVPAGKTRICIAGYQH